MAIRARKPTLTQAASDVGNSSFRAAQDHRRPLLKS